MVGNTVDTRPRIISYDRVLQGQNVQDAIAYVLILAAFVLPGFAMILFLVRVLQAVYINQSLLLSFPLP